MDRHREGHPVKTVPSLSSDQTLTTANKSWRANRPSASQALSSFHSIAPVGAHQSFDCIQPMQMKPIRLVCCLALASCSPKEPKDVTWHASIDNGCKSGIGIELIQTDSSLSGAVFILDPDKPHDFASGRRCDMEIRRSEAQDICFTVHFLPQRSEDLHLHLKSPLMGDRVQAVLRDTTGSDAPTEFEFHRVQ